jgi:hypothetical protein
VTQYGFASDEIAARPEQKIQAPALTGPHQVIDAPAAGQLSMGARGDALQVVGVQRELIAEVHLVRVHDLRCSVKGAAVVWQL